jgi:hypothetical protein
MIQDKIFFDEKDPTGLSYNTPFTVYGSYEGRLWSKTPSGEIKYYTQNSDLSVYATTGSNQFEGAQDITGSLTVTGSFNLNDSATNFNILGNQFGETYLISNNGNIVLHPVGDSEGIVIVKETDLSVEGDITVNNLYASNGVVSGSSQIVEYNVFATTGSNQFDGSQAITGSLTVTGQVVAQTLNVQQVTSSIVFSSGSNIFGNSLANTQQFTGSVSVTGSLTVNGAGTFTGNVAATGGTFINGSNQNTLGGGALSLLNYVGYNSSANQNVILGLGLNDAVDNNIAYQYILGVGGNASGQNLSLTSKRNNTTDLTILSINGTTGASTFGSSVTAVNAILSGTGNAFADGLRINRNSNTNQYTVINHLGGATNIVSVDQSGNNIAEIYFGRSTNGSTISNSMMINASGNVGIGTPSALQTLTLAGTQMMYNTAGDGNTNTIIGSITSQVRNYGTGIATSSFASIQFATDSTTWFKGDIRFLTNGSDGTASAGTERLRITSGGLIRITNFTSNGLVGTDAAGNLGVVNNTYTEIPTGTISYSMTAGSPWAINNSFPATIRDFNDDAMAGSGDDSTGANQSRGVTFDLGSAKAVRKIVERGYPTKNLNVIVVQYSTDNSNWTEIHAYKHVYGNTQKDMEFNPTGAIAARYWRWFIDSWTTRETQNYYTYESIIYT